QDWLGLDDKSRINVPSTVGKNWRWRLIENQLTEKLKNEILKTTRIFGRV
ncbi:MAG: 4-alpha-glucanotransferase, partial [Ruminiclostridium sp.]|nr:4-alpha-glucanotransferase [Ruminiclostridium sp.]